MRTLLTALLLSLLLVAAACADEGTDDGDTATGGEQSTQSEADATTPPEEAPGATLAEGVAATVNGAEIATEEVESRMSAAEADEEFAAALEGEQGEQVASQFRAQTLSVLVQTRIVLDAAEELGANPTEQDIAQTRTEIAEEFGGEEQLDEAVEGSGMSQEAFEEQLRGVAALEIVGRTLVERGEVPEPPEGAEETDPAELAVQQWLGEQLAAADVVVDGAYGEWNAQAGQVLPTPVDE